MIKELNKYFTSDVEKFFMQNRYLSQYSGQRRNQKKKKRKHQYRQIFENSDSLQTFNVDLMENSRKELNHNSTNYTLIAVDIVSRYIFYENLLSKKTRMIVEVFKSLLKKIRKLKNIQLQGLDSNDFITFIRKVLILIFEYYYRGFQHYH